jgi:hypothetical protein
VVLVVFSVDTFHDDPRAFWAMIGIVVLGVVADAVWKRIRKTEAQPLPLPS